MMTRGQTKWPQFLLILAVLPCYWSVEVSIPQKEYRVKKGEDVTLSCSFVPANPIQNSFILSWDALPKDIGSPSKIVASYFINNPIDISPSYEGRATLDVDINKGTSTLRLTQVTMQDSRPYQCGVRISGDDEGTPTASTTVLVLEPPSKPECSLQGQAEYFQDVVLTCNSKEGSPTPLYKWTTYSVENIPRQFPPKTTEKDGVLSLFNISKETSGFFVCVSKNDYGSASCNFTLAVMPGSMSFGSTPLIIGGVLGGLLVLGIIIFCCYRKKGKKGKHVDGSPDDIVYYDKDGSEAGEQYHDEKKVNQNEEKDKDQQTKHTVERLRQNTDDDQFSYNSGKARDDDSQHQKEPRFNHGGIREPNDDRSDRIGSRDRLDDQRDRYGSRDRLEDQRDRYGSRDRLEDQRDHYGSRDRLEDQRDRYGSRDRLEDQRDRYGSRDRLEDQRDRYGSRDRLEDQRDRYGSRDRLEEQRDRYGSRDRLDDRRDLYTGSRD